MPILLFRIDERLIHGQVVVGWGSFLNPHRYLVVDRTLAHCAWEQELYLLGLPEGVTALFRTPEEARQELAEWRSSPLRSLLLTRDVGAMVEVARNGLLAGETVNLGGLHYRKERVGVLSYLFLDPEDRAALRELEDEGVRVSAQDLPSSPEVALAALLERGREP